MILKPSVRLLVTLLCKKEWRVFSIPLHRELKKGTLIGILKQAGIGIEDFKREFK